MKCVFYNQTIQKKVPCILIPGELYGKTSDYKRKLYVHVYFDPTEYINYNVTQEELNRYCSEFVNIYDIYPMNTIDQQNYANAVIPDKVTNNSDELDRFEAIVNMLTDVSGDIDDEMFYYLADFISYELLFTYSTQQERVFMLTISSIQLTEQPLVVEIPQIVRMTKRIFEKFTEPIDSLYDIDNYNNYHTYKDILPRTLNIDFLKYNVNFIII